MGNVIGPNIKRCREARAWTQERLAEIAAVNVRTVQRAERGEMIAAESLQDLAAALDVPLEMLRVDPEDMLKQAEEFAKRYKVIPLARIEHAHELKNCLTAGALQMETVALDAPQREVVAELEQALGDYLNLWRDLQPIERHRAYDDLQRPIEQLQAMGLVVAAGVEELRLRSDKTPDPWTMEVFYVMISLASDPKLAVARERKRQISFA
jgi:transcriptional regulator with XRE-family HTH domain